jgi:hypothetical protein
MKNFWAKHKTLLSFIFHEVWLPFLVAAAWALLALSNGKSPSSVKDMVLGAQNTAADRPPAKGRRILCPYESLAA